MLEEATTWLASGGNFAIGVIVASGLVGIWLLKQVIKHLLEQLLNFVKWRLTRKIEVSLEIKGYLDHTVRKGVVLLKPRTVKRLSTELLMALKPLFTIFKDRHDGFMQNAVEIFFGKYGFWYELRCIRRRYTERCKCPVPYLSVPESAVAFKRADNWKLWARDDIPAVRYLAKCEICSKDVFVSRPDMVSMAMTLYNNR